ncbi:hypothetical protein JCM10550A_22430 [Methanogenium cariaci]
MLPLRDPVFPAWQAKMGISLPPDEMPDAFFSVYPALPCRAQPNISSG